mmetsp:Transcript_132512/g.330461  ORF Transcript_132512/g.330461 Transcript_132512/m.330461 type:complete len:310 (-) Transcript_132512:968-1897(-)
MCWTLFVPAHLLPLYAKQPNGSKYQRCRPYQQILRYPGHIRPQQLDRSHGISAGPAMPCSWHHPLLNHPRWRWRWHRHRCPRVAVTKISTIAPCCGTSFGRTGNGKTPVVEELITVLVCPHTIFFGLSADPLQLSLQHLNFRLRLQRMVLQDVPATRSLCRRGPYQARDEVEKGRRHVWHQRGVEETIAESLPLLAAARQRPGIDGKLICHGSEREDVPLLQLGKVAPQHLSCQISAVAFTDIITTIERSHSKAEVSDFPLTTTTAAHDVVRLDVQVHKATGAGSVHRVQAICDRAYNIHDLRGREERI